MSVIKNVSTYLHIDVKVVFKKKQFHVMVHSLGMATVTDKARTPMQLE